MSGLASCVLADTDIQILRRRLSFLLKNSADVEDVIQDAYIRVLEYSQSGMRIGNPPAFLHRVARNLAIDRIRWQQRTARICGAADDSEEIGSQVQNAASNDKQADEMLEYDQNLQLLYKVVAQLPPKCRQAYLMSSLEGRTYREISTAVGLSVSMIEKYVLRARRHIAAALAPTYAMAS
jgi:RNA polymerase sigma factor (sigma-70 family)